MSLLSVDKLSLDIGETPILRDVSFTVDAGEVVGLVGESGSGKSMTALALLDLLPRNARRTGAITLDGSSLADFGEREMVALRGREIGMVFQEPMTALNPVITIGDQVAEVLTIHGASRREARARASEALAGVGLPNDEISHARYPHELSGGQRQRVGIAIATVLRPKLLIADEPTTALDVTTQAQILALLADLVKTHRMGLILITHDLAVVADMARKLVILKDGAVVETGAAETVFTRPAHAYTRQLLAASAHRPERRNRGPEATGEPVLQVEGLVRRYRLHRALPFAPRHWFDALKGVSLHIMPGESVGVVGESGSGKSTLARAIMGLEAPDAGSIRVAGAPVSGPRGTAFATRRVMQMVFQDPYGSFDPRQTVETLVAEPFHLLGAVAPRGPARRDAVADALEAVGLRRQDGEKYIHEFSGGQRQRIAIARALIVRPQLVVLDEPVSALDVTIRAQILDLLAQLSDQFGLAYLFIAHDLDVVRAITDRVAVMHRGEIVEMGSTEEILSAPSHPYTRALLQASPRLDRAMARWTGRRSG